MDIPFSRYTEKLPEEFSVRHKITETTEKRNFHLHRQMEIIFALSGNLKCKFETGEIDIPRNGLILFNQMDLHYIYPEEPLTRLDAAYAILMTHDIEFD